MGIEPSFFQEILSDLWCPIVSPLPHQSLSEDNSMRYTREVPHEASGNTEGTSRQSLGHMHCKHRVQPPKCSWMLPVGHLSLW